VSLTKSFIIQLKLKKTKTVFLEFPKLFCCFVLLMIHYNFFPSTNKKTSLQQQYSGHKQAVKVSKKKQPG